MLLAALFQRIQAIDSAEYILNPARLSLSILEVLLQICKVVKPGHDLVSGLDFTEHYLTMLEDLKSFDHGEVREKAHSILKLLKVH